MPRLTQAELSVLADGLRELYAQTDVAPLRETLVRVAARLVPCDVGSYNEVDRATAKPLLSLRFPDCGEFRKHFPAFVAYFSEHPITRFTRRTGRTDAVKLSDFVTQRQLGRVRIYNEYYRAIGIRHQMVLFFESNGEPIQRAISLNRSSCDFSERDRMIVNLLQPHFLQAYRNAQTLTELRVATHAMEQVHAASAKAILLVGQHGRIKWLSELSRTWLREYCRADAGPGSCVPEPIARWLAQNRERRRALQECPDVGLPLRLSTAAGTISVDFAAEDQEGNISLVLTRHRPHAESSNVRLPGLTARENEILGWIAQGKSNPDIAGILGLSVRTVYKHVENIFPKLGVENRAAAMLRALDAANSIRPS